MTISTRGFGKYRQFGKAEEIAALIVSLCADETANITGTNIVADNGQSTMLL